MIQQSGTEAFAQMVLTSRSALLAGGSFSALAALAHLATILIGPAAYRFMGAGEAMAQAAEAGSWRPTLITLAISAVLLVWAGYAWSGAGIIRRLPLTRLVLLAITGVYLGRALAFPWLRPAFPDNSQTFWLVSSSICLLIGLLYGYGLIRRWSVL